MSNPICFALDVPKLSTAQGFVDRLEEHVGAFKVGLEMFIASGAMPLTKKPVVLDLKLHDIPETVARAVKAGGDLGVKYMTLHIQQRKTLEEAVKAAEPFGITLLGVTVLTSMTEQDCEALMLPSLVTQPSYDPGLRALNLASFAYSHGLRGFVCSPQEVGALHTKHPDAFYLVPGVRPLGAEVGDQRRTGTPGGAVIDGADLVVIGRPIRDANDPVVTAQAILKEIEDAQRIEKVAQQGMMEISR
jgi:orotidine-5'-phosphate decarboxylase